MQVLDVQERGMGACKGLVVCGGSAAQLRGTALAWGDQGLAGGGALG